MLISSLQLARTAMPSGGASTAPAASSAPAPSAVVHGPSIPQIAAGLGVLALAVGAGIALHHAGSPGAMLTRFGKPLAIAGALGGTALALAGCTSTPSAPGSGTTSPGTERPGGDSTDTIGAGPGKLTLTPVATKLDSPVSVDFERSGNTAYVAGQGGRVVHIDAAGKRTTVLDISSDILAGGEQGLLGMALHPDFATNHKLYVMYNGLDSKLRVGEVTLGAGGFATGKPKELLRVDTPSELQNGGQLAFDAQGMLNIAVGDGGNGAHGGNIAADRSSLFGKILRIDVDHPANGRAYGIPADNPDPAGAGGRAEVIAGGLRNPWRFSIDSASGDILIGDVGQGQREEIDRIAGGDHTYHDFGWSGREGSIAFSKDAQRAGTTDPIFEYPHGPQGGNAVIGGIVYRGSAMPDLKGWYIYGDVGTTSLTALKIVDGKVADHRTIETGAPMIDAFAQDAHGEIYATSFDGKLYRLGDH